MTFFAVCCNNVFVNSITQWSRLRATVVLFRKGRYVTRVWCRVVFLWWYSLSTTGFVSVELMSPERNPGPVCVGTYLTAVLGNGVRRPRDEPPQRMLVQPATAKDTARQPLRPSSESSRENFHVRWESSNGSSGWNVPVITEMAFDYWLGGRCSAWVMIWEYDLLCSSTAKWHLITGRVYYAHPW